MSPDVVERAPRLRGGRGIKTERWQRVERLFHEALALADDARAAWLDAECDGDADLRAEVESMVASASRGDALLERDAVEEAAPLLAYDEEADSLAGTELGHYHLERRLGRGGMGEVYLARDGRLGRQVAIKLLDPALGLDRRWQARFLEEARVAALLDHPNVCTIHEVGEHEGRPFIVMQYVTGRTLKDLIGGQPLPPEVLMSLSVQVGEALAAAHEQGIIHRDVKAANVMVTPQGLAKVLDFGIAKRLEVDALAASTAATAAGTILGTPGSMAPEQAAGARTDRRSDIFSFGVLLYEMATGRTPFPGESWAERMTAVLYEPHPPLDLVPGMSPRLPAVIDRALAKQPNDR
ncbi:MAG TPA: serine/threonine-protein kinase, partial [Thermoanaerobaculia bacterium]|nr:serine/threonine-protein kinase [Thermoanaerobaculia bacterium]